MPPHVPLFLPAQRLGDMLCQSSGQTPVSTRPFPSIFMLWGPWGGSAFTSFVGNRAVPPFQPWVSQGLGRRWQGHRCPNVWWHPQAWRPTSQAPQEIRLSARETVKVACLFPLEGDVSFSLVQIPCRLWISGNSSSSKCSACTTLKRRTRSFGKLLKNTTRSLLK